MGGDFDFGFGEDMVLAVEMYEVQDSHPLEVDAFATRDCIGFEKPDQGQVEDSVGAQLVMEVVGAHVDPRVQKLWDAVLVDLIENVRFLVH